MGDETARQGLDLDERGDVGVLTLDRPDRRNALSRAVLHELAATLVSLDARPMRAVVLQGAGDCFSAGADLGELDGSLADLSMDDAVAAAAGAVRGISLPVICAIEGPCVGAAVELAMACDLRIVSATAFFELPAVRLGILYRPGAVAELSKQLAPGALSRLLLFGDRLHAAEAAALGIAAAPVVPAAGALSRALEVAGTLPGAPSSSAARATKRLLVALARGDDPSEFEDTRRLLASSPERVDALGAARRRVSGRST